MENAGRKLANAELGRLSVADFKTTKKYPFALVLDQVRSALNVGSVFRTADAFLARKVVLCGLTAQPPHREIEKTALGATDTVAWVHFETTEAALAALRAEGYYLVALEQTTASVSLFDFRPPADRACAFIFGHEVRGVSEAALAQADVCLEIPQFGSKHSLNVAVSAGVVAWDFLSKHGPLVP